MSKLELLKSKNPGLNFYTLDDPGFQKYGKRCTVEVQEYLDIIEESLPIPEEVKYVASEPQLEKAAAMKERISREVYGEMPIQVGYCAGHNTRLNGLEYHRGSEVIIAATDMVLLLCEYAKIMWSGEDCTLDVSQVEAVYVQKGETVELYPMVMHLAPDQVCDDGFFGIIILPEGTNSPLSGEKAGKLIAVNKWLFSCEGIPSGQGGIKGENINVKY